MTTETVTTTTTTAPTVALLYPGHAAEDDFALIESALGGVARLPVIITDIDSDDHTVEAMRAVGTSTPLLDGARKAAAHSPDALMWSCTSGSFLYGWDGAHAQVREVADMTGLPVSSTSLAFVAACRALGLDKVAVAATYPAPVADGFTAFLADAGIEALANTANDIATAAAAGLLDDAALLSMVTSADRPGAQAILVPDTALHTIAQLPELEAAAGKPVLTANQVTAWQGLRLTGTDVAGPALGSLFAGADR